jgi:hypothetical protein
MNILKDYGIFILLYILFCSILILKLGMYKQCFIITILIVFYLYYKFYYSSIPELINNTKSTFNNITNNYNNISSINDENNISSINDENNISSINNENNINKKNIKLESDIISLIPSSYKLNIIKEDIKNFIDNYIPENSRNALQVKQENNKVNAKNKINKYINKYFITLNTLINNSSNELEYFQQIKNYEKEILTIIHNSIFLNHKANDQAGLLIDKTKTIFNNIQSELSTLINTRNSHHNKEYIPTINEFKDIHNFENGILF